MSAVQELETFTAEELLEYPLEKIPWIVEDLISVGYTIFGGAPKIGKSWAALQLGLAVSKGDAFLGFHAEQGTVLYLCLEDTKARIQQRLFHVVDEANGKFHFATFANSIDAGLLEQIDMFISKNPNTTLVIIDTLQTIRNASYDGSYAADYSIGTALHRYAVNNGIALVTIHHTRKMEAQDILDLLLGTRGATGSADAAMVLTRDNRFDGNAKLSADGRDMSFVELKLHFDNGTWELVERTSREELAERDRPATVLAVLDFMAARTMGWAGTASELIKDAAIPDIKPNILAKHLNEHCHYLLERGIDYSRDRTRTSRTIYLDKVPVGAADE